MSVMPSWTVRVQGTGSSGDPAVLQTTVDATSAATALTLVIDRTRKLDWSDVKRIEITKKGSDWDRPLR